ncbi:hypothetical protein Taro_045295 [Colocasia esculenta]|uniref:Uncharacterized protein n=1 Tax=Colocasia esculenta TaxID=4460 RepID=A0A843WZY5_COLES|nr:hypothetical protein [Colocasia esculenta]
MHSQLCLRIHLGAIAGEIQQKLLEASWGKDVARRLVWRPCRAGKQGGVKLVVPSCVDGYLDGELRGCWMRMGDVQKMAMRPGPWCSGWATRRRARLCCSQCPDQGAAAWDLAGQVCEAAEDWCGLALVHVLCCNPGAMAMAGPCGLVLGDVLRRPGLGTAEVADMQLWRRTC